MLQVHGTADHPLTKWRLKQDPPWPVVYLAERLGTSAVMLSRIMSRVQKNRATPTLAYAVEVLTDGEIKMIDMLLTPEQRAEIKARVKNGSGS